MKRCPQCRETYADDSLRFCLEDGSKLVTEAAPAETVRYSQGSPALEPTLAVSMPLTPGTGALAKTKRSLPLVIIAAVLVAAVALTWVLLRSAATGHSTSTADSGPPGAEPPHIRGNPKAPVTLEEFGDFECPTCATYAVEVKKIESEFGDRLRVVFREYPLYPTPHKHALVAAQAAEAAGLQGRFWEMHDKLYENQKAWSEAADVMPMFIDYARQIGLDVDRFGRDLKGEVVADRVFQDGRRGHALGISGTPSFFINGKEAKYEDQSWTPEGLRKMINQALSALGK